MTWGQSAAPGAGGHSGSAPIWSAPDDSTADLLTVLADDGTLTTEAEWDIFAGCLRGVAHVSAGLINPNVLRVALRGRVKPQRVGPFYRRACLEGLIVADGWVVSEDRAGKNAGRPSRTYRWIA